MSESQNLLALDVGEKRIGVALANTTAQLAHPLLALENTQDVYKKISELISEHKINKLIIGLPRNLQGKDTSQTVFTQEFMARLEEFVTIPMHWQDEALTSVLAREELDAKKIDYQKGDVDKLAAAYILQDFLDQQPN